MSFSTTTAAYHKQLQDGNFVKPRKAGSFAALADAPEYAKIIFGLRHESMEHGVSRQACGDYMKEIMEHMRQMEDVTQPVVALIDTQPQIRWSMRPLLLDFIIDAHQAFQLLPETLFLTVNLLDRYCSTRVVLKHNYQLIGCASLLIAAKYGERKNRVPMIEELKSMCGSVYDEQMFIQTEWHVLDILEWKIGHPTVYSFLQVALLEGNDEVEVEHMAQYICEVALYHRDFVSTKPSIMARASIAVARTIRGCHKAFSLNETEHRTAWQLYQHLHNSVSLPKNTLLLAFRLLPSASRSSWHNVAIGKGPVVAPTLLVKYPESQATNSTTRIASRTANGHQPTQISPVLMTSL